MLTGIAAGLAAGAVWGLLFVAPVPTLILGTIPIWIMLLGKPAGLRWAGLLPGLVLTALGLGLMMASPHAQAGAAPAHYWRGVVLALVT